MHALVTVTAALIAVAAAARSTWSPCGVSMLATVTPLAERGRGHRYRSTAAWFIAGGTTGGATLGLVMAALALGVRAAEPSAVALATVASAVAVLAAAMRHPARRLRPALPLPAGQRALARPIPPVGLRRGVRLADRRRPRDLHQDGRALPHDRPGRPDGEPRHRVGRRRPVRSGARTGRPPRPGHRQPRQPSPRSIGASPGPGPSCSAWWWPASLWSPWPSPPCSHPGSHWRSPSSGSRGSRPAAPAAGRASCGRSS